MKPLHDQAAKCGLRLTQYAHLLAPLGYWALSKAQKDNICNGCGPGRLRWIVPDKIAGFDFTEACNIHDYCFNHYKCTFRLANDLFAYNMYALVKKREQNVWRIGYWIVGKYVGAVKSLAGRFFYWRSRRVV